VIWNSQGRGNSQVVVEEVEVVEGVEGVEVVLSLRSI
jgi:hypothetical protein